MGGTVYCLTDGEATGCCMVAQGQELMRCEERAITVVGKLETLLFTYQLDWFEPDTATAVRACDH